MYNEEGTLYLMAESRKSTKKVVENRKMGKNSAEKWEKKCAGNRKMIFIFLPKFCKIINYFEGSGTKIENTGTSLDFGQ